MNASRCLASTVLAVLIPSVSAVAAETAFYRMRANGATTITSLDRHGVLSWACQDAETPECTVQRSSTLSGGEGWADFTHVDVTNASMSVQVMDPDPVPGMVWIPPGWNRGTNPDNEVDYEISCGGFRMDRTEATWQLWNDVRAWAVTNGYAFDGTGAGKAADHPVQNVSWFDCVRWCNARSEREGLTPCYDLQDWTCDFAANGYRLPTSAEWEYAARGGQIGLRFPWGDLIDHDRDNYFVWVAGKFDYDEGYEGSDVRYATGELPYTNPVEAFPANGYGLFGMAGNVAEWCWDLNEEYFGFRCVRGGYWDAEADVLRCGSEHWVDPVTQEYGWYGFRTVRR
ncbi:MAG: formylglycine-generating enzyme family protein [Lentisphaerae bacterium]|nr:formylglycine-generating enzyme family protein [Lentisphaerota bacterium]